MYEYVGVLVVGSDPAVLWDSAVFSSTHGFLTVWSVQTAIPGRLVLFLSAVKKAKSWLESKVLYIAKGCAPFILSGG